jgi:hypothetical protein
MCSSSGEGMEQTPTQLGPLERANLNHWTRASVPLPSHEDGNRSSFRNVVFSSNLEFLTMDKAHKPCDFKC